MILAMLGARFRDIAQVIQSVIQVIFFLTPVMWMPKLLPEKYFFVMKFNPFAQFIDLVREPLMGAWPTFYTNAFVLGLTVFGIAIMLLLFMRVRHRIIYWL
jgi:ABC-type polysaccharide/polyol phosphate export permease